MLGGSRTRITGKPDWSPSMHAHLLTAVFAAFSFVAQEPAERLQFSLPDTDGKRITLPDFASRYVLFVYQGIP